MTIGAVIGHALCTGLAVLGGRMIAQKISVKTGKLLHQLLIHYIFFPMPVEKSFINLD